MIMNKKQLIIIAVVLSLLILTSGIALAGGVKNTTYIKFFGSGAWKDSYWKTTGSGLVHEWRTTDNRHFVFKPVGKFSAPDCDADKLIDAFTWKSHWYEHDLVVSEATIDDFLPYGNWFHVCMYRWR
jgi:hypothetical protein